MWLIFQFDYYIVVNTLFEFMTTSDKREYAPVVFPILSNETQYSVIHNKYIYFELSTHYCII